MVRALTPRGPERGPLAFAIDTRKGLVKLMGMSKQLSMFGARSGVETFRPYAHGDVIVKSDGSRFVVIANVPDAYARPALACVSLAHGGNAIVFVDEVAYRSVSK